jgi:hypothetical protein
MMKQRIAPSAATMVCAIVVAGTVAGARVSPGMWLLTVVVAAVMLHGATRDADAAIASGVAIRELPPVLRERVRSTFTQLPEGDARRLLLSVVNQARLVFLRDESRFDAAEERQLTEHVTGLVEACCSSAADLARLDQFTGAGNADGSLNSDLAGRATKARELFRERLTNAASALAELYTANVEHGTPSTDRVAELTAEISSDAAARAAATSEMEKLLPG